MEVHPQKMISIMSIPGGLTISHWEPTVPNPSDSISNPPSMLASQSLLQNTQSFHSRNQSDYMGSLGTHTGSPGQNMGIIVSPSERTQISSSGQNIIVSPSERTQNPYLYIPTISVQNLSVSSTQMDASTHDKVHMDQSKVHKEDRVSGSTSTKFLSPPHQQIQSPKQSPNAGLSPRAKVMSPVLCAIPEIMNGQSVSIPQSEVSGANCPPIVDNDAEKWINNDSHPYLTHRSDSGGSLVSGSMQSSSRVGVQSDTSLSAKESNSSSSHTEIDVFKHLFDDHDELNA